MSEGFHTEKSDTPLGPLNISVENEGYKLDLDLTQSGTEDDKDTAGADAFAEETMRLLLPDWKELSRAWAEKPARRPDLALTITEHDVDTEDMGDRIVANFEIIDAYVKADPVRRFEMSYGALVHGLFVESQRYERDESWLASKSTELADKIAAQAQLNREEVSESLKQIWQHVAEAESPAVYYDWLCRGMPNTEEDVEEGSVKAITSPNTNAIRDMLARTATHHGDIIKARDAITERWCEANGIKSKDDLTMEQILSIREMQQWQDPFAARENSEFDKGEL